MREYLRRKAAKDGQPRSRTGWRRVGRFVQQGTVPHKTISYTIGKGQSPVRYDLFRYDQTVPDNANWRGK